MLRHPSLARAGEVESGFSESVTRPDIEREVQQKFDDPGAPVFRSEHERRHLRVSGAELRSGSPAEKLIGDLGVSFFGGKEERRLIVPIAFVGIRLMLEQKSDETE